MNYYIYNKDIETKMNDINFQKIISEAIDNVIAESDKNRQKIDSIVAESINNQVIRKEIENIVKENITKIISNKIFEYINESDIDKDKKRYSNKYKSVMRSLKDDGINKADLMRSLWHPKDQNDEDAKRSLFSKKANGKPDADGAIRKFTPTEINKLYDLIRNLGK